MIEKNDVSAAAQVRRSNYVGVVEQGGKTNVLFLGNSITRHEPKKEIGWENDWGMAATKRENDYVHVAVRLMEERIGKVNYCIANCGEWELNYFQDGLLSSWEAARRFQADIVVVRLGENILQAREHFAAHPIAPHYKAMVEYFAAKKGAKVILTDLFWRQEEINAAIDAVARQTGYPLVSLGDLGEEKENMAIGQFWHDGVAIHPNDTGMRKIAERIVEQL